MRIRVLASGSKGNSTLITTPLCKVLIDVGLTKKALEERLNPISLSEIDAIIITHTHSDHIKGLEVIEKNYPIKVYSTEYIDKDITIKDLNFHFFELSHDVICMGMVIKHQEEEMVYITDTGYINNKLFPIIENKDCYILESNYDDKLLMEGSYPYQLKQRILKSDGHLSNNDSAKYMAKLIGKKTKKIVLAHLSEENNRPEIAYETMHKVISKEIDLYVARQQESLEEIEI